LITEVVEVAHETVERFGRAVFKPLFSTKARGMRIIEAGDEALSNIIQFKEEGHQMMYIQKMERLPGWDMGIAFLGGEYLGTYSRVGAKESWNTTHRAGGKYQRHDPSQEIIELARRAQEPFGLDFTSVDVAETDHGPIVFEVSAFGGFHGLLDGCGIDAAEQLCDYVLRKIDERQ
jgi:ribosomal protein S6--L-glutamate ligase